MAALSNAMNPRDDAQPQEQRGNIEYEQLAVATERDAPDVPASRSADVDAAVGSPEVPQEERDLIGRKLKDFRGHTLLVRSLTVDS
jgi:hypothetical protein